jgi:hypothetical protein
VRPDIGVLRSLKVAFNLFAQCMSPDRHAFPTPLDTIIHKWRLFDHSKVVSGNASPSSENTTSLLKLPLTSSRLDTFGNY